MDNLFSKFIEFINSLKQIHIKKPYRQGREYRRVIMESIGLGMISDAEEYRKCKNSWRQSSYFDKNHDKFNDRKLLNEYVDKMITIDNFRFSGLYRNEDIYTYIKYPNKIKLLGFESFKSNKKYTIFVECIIKTKYSRQILFSHFNIGDSDLLSLSRNNRLDDLLSN